MICSDVLDELQRSSLEETITIIHPAGDKGIKEVSPNLDWKQNI